MARGIFRREAQYDRRKLLASAAKARKRGKAKRAIEYYRRVLEAEPHDAEVHRKVAPLLARVGQHQAALDSFSQAMQGLLRAGFDEHALGVCMEAAGIYPQKAELWEAIAGLRMKASKASDAVSALVEGRRHLRRRKDLPNAIRLLARAHEIDPENPKVAIDLSRLLKRAGERAKATAVLAKLDASPGSRGLRSVRLARLRNDPSLGSALLWLRAVLANR